MSELNRQLKRVPENYDYAVQTLYEDTWEWRFYPLNSRYSYLGFITTLEYAEETLRTIGLPARLVKISRYAPFGGDDILVHSVLKLNTEAMKKKV